MGIFKLLSQIVIDPDIELDIPLADAPNDETIAYVLEIIFGIAGAVSMLMIVIAGMQYILSRGDSQKAGNARSTIIYAGVGMAVALSAFAMVRFVVRSI
jgi:hypothetical protein